MFKLERDPASVFVQDQALKQEASQLRMENAQLREENQELRAQLVASTAHIRELSAAGRA